MIKVLNIASQGMLQAESRATNVASKIIRATSKAASFSLETADKGQKSTPAVSIPLSDPSGAGFSNLLQHMVDLKAEEHSFKASAAAFKKADEALDSALGVILDKDG